MDNGSVPTVMRDKRMLLGIQNSGSFYILTFNINKERGKERPREKERSATRMATQKNLEMPRIYTYMYIYRYLKHLKI